jgi:3'(2'), 5'-bisphosphate nucleotidase
MHYYNQSQQDPEFVQYKQDNSPVTEADIVSNEIITGGLKQLNEVYPIISEESHVPIWEERANYSRVWLVDPLDGTREFVNQNDEFAIHIGLAEYGKPILGVVYAPAKEILYYAIRRMGAFKENKEGGTRLKVRTLDMKDKGLHILHSRSHLNKR